jgi:serine acetyltransferase
VGFLLCGRSWPALRLPFVVVSTPLGRGIGGRCEAHYEASIGPGFHVLHPSLGLVISGTAVIGSGFTAVGGNRIGSRFPSIAPPGPTEIGNDVTTVANAVVLDPVTIGDNAVVPACSLVLRNVPAAATVGGVPSEVLFVRHRQ